MIVFFFFVLLLLVFCDLRLAFFSARYASVNGAWFHFYNFFWHSHSFWNFSSPHIVTKHIPNFALMVIKVLQSIGVHFINVAPTNCAVKVNNKSILFCSFSSTILDVAFPMNSLWITVCTKLYIIYIIWFNRTMKEDSEASYLL